jgi:hypothetical protein
VVGEAVDLSVLVVVLVVRQLALKIEQQNDADSDAQGKPQDVEDGISAVFHKQAKSELDVVDQHSGNLELDAKLA